MTGPDLAGSPCWLHLFRPCGWTCAMEHILQLLAGHGIFQLHRWGSWALKHVGAMDRPSQKLIQMAEVMFIALAGIMVFQNFCNLWIVQTWPALNIGWPSSFWAATGQVLDL